VKQIHHEELKGSDNEWPSAFPKIMLKQADTGVQQLHGAGKRTQDQQRIRPLLVDSPNANKARGIVRAAAYNAQIDVACVGMAPILTRYCGLTIPTMEKPLATRTLIAVTTEASRIALIAVIDSSLSALVQTKLGDVRL
jgi:hypothetical protein